ncbi:MAG: hypothetical protein F6K39_25310 [Okeania sp. SIO3B3]|nr:hypothetical protein [Okeania sp. SIO3B3]
MKNNVVISCSVKYLYFGETKAESRRQKRKKSPKYPSLSVYPCHNQCEPLPHSPTPYSPTY